MKTGAELKARREELKIKQQDLADQLGISRTQLSRYENGLREADESIIEKWRGVLFGLKFSDLEVGDYVYVRDDLVDSKYYGNNTYDSRIGKGLLEITKLNKFMYVNNCIYDVTPEMIDLSRSMKKEDYLKMNEKEKEYTLDDVIDVAVNGCKNGLFCMTMDDKGFSISKTARGDTHHFNKDDNNSMIHSNKGKDIEKSFCEVIDFIKSLYTEEFVIETMADGLRVKSGAELTLSNGINCVYFDDGDRKLRYDDDFYPCNFLILKGATVKQHKGIK